MLRPRLHVDVVHRGDDFGYGCGEPRLGSVSLGGTYKTFRFSSFEINLTGKWPPYLATATNNWNSVIGGYAKAH